MFEDLYKEIFQIGGERNEAIDREIEEKYGVSPIPLEANSMQSIPVMNPNQSDIFGVEVENSKNMMPNYGPIDFGDMSGAVNPNYKSMTKAPTLSPGHLPENDIVVPEGIMDEDPAKNMASYDTGDFSQTMLPPINPGGSSLESRAYMLGVGLGAEKGTSGKGMSIIGGIGSLGLGLGRNIAAGVGNQRRQDYVENQYRKRQQQDMRKYNSAPTARNNNYTGGLPFKIGGTTKYQDGSEVISKDPYTEDDFKNDSTFLYNQTKPYLEQAGDVDFYDYTEGLSESAKNNLYSEMTQLYKSPVIQDRISRMTKYKGIKDPQFLAEKSITGDRPNMKDIQAHIFKKPTEDIIPQKKPPMAIPKEIRPGAMGGGDQYKQHQMQQYNISSEEYDDAKLQQEERELTEQAIRQQEELKQRNNNAVGWSHELLKRELSKPNLEESRRTELQQLYDNNYGEANPKLEEGGYFSKPIGFYQGGGDTQSTQSDQQPQPDQSGQIQQQMMQAAQQLIQEIGPDPEKIAQYLQQQGVDEQTYNMIMQMVVSMLQQGQQEAQIQQQKEGGKILI